MIQKIAISIIIIFSVGLLSLQRYYVSETIPVSVIKSQNSSLNLQTKLKRGQFIQTNQSETLLLKLGDNLLALDENSKIELISLDVAEPKVRLYQGRLFAKTISPLTIRTDFTESYLTTGKTSFVNTSENHLIQIIPHSGTAVTQIRELDETLLIPVPYEIKEAPPAWHQESTFNISDAKEFYEWLDLEE